MFSMPQKRPLTTKSDSKTSVLSLNRVQMFSMPQKRPLTTKSDSKTSVLSFQIESKCFLFLKKGPLRQNPTSKHRFYHFKSSPNVFYASKKAPYDKIRLQNIGFIISNRVQMFSMPQKRPLTTKSDSKTSVLSSNRVQMFSMPQKRPLTTKSDFKTSVLSFQIESKCFLCLKKGPLRQNPTSKHRFYH